jgi:capsular polysaccharide biosynthesis protein/Mrp family chromosome partitioning ATPase
VEQKNLIAVARKWWVVLIAAAVVGGLVARAVAAFLQPTYESTVRLLTGPTSSDVNTLEAAGGLARTYSELATSQPQLQAVAQELGLNLTPDQLAEDVQSTSNDVTRVVSIRVRRPTAEGAQEFATRLGNRMVALAGEGSKRDEELADELLRQDAFAGLSDAQRRSIRNAAGTVLGQQRAPGTLTVVDPARVASGPVSPKIPLIVLLGAFCGVALAGAVIVARERRSGTIDDARSLAATVDAPLLGTVSGWDLRAGLVVRSTPGSDAANEVRRLADQISYVARDGSVRSVVLIGVEHGGPGGAVAANLGAALAAPDFRVVVVDADPDQADVTRLFRLSNHSGLADFVHGEGFDANGSGPDVLGVLRGADLTVIPAGASRGAHRRLDSRRVRELVESLQSESEMVLIVPPSLERSSDALVWAEQADGTVIVAEQRATATADIQRARDRVTAVRARIIGTVFFGTRAIPGLGRLTDRVRWGSAKAAPRSLPGSAPRDRSLDAQSSPEIAPVIEAGEGRADELVAPPETEHVATIVTDTPDVEPEVERDADAAAGDKEAPAATVGGAAVQDEEPVVPPAVEEASSRQEPPVETEVTAETHAETATPPVEPAPEPVAADKVADAPPPPAADEEQQEPVEKPKSTTARKGAATPRKRTSTTPRRRTGG